MDRYPDKLAWQMELTRKDIRRCEAYYKLHNFLISETEHGTISRQETVSMIPPLVLDVQPHHKVINFGNYFDFYFNMAAISKILCEQDHHFVCK